MIRVGNMTSNWLAGGRGGSEEAWMSRTHPKVWRWCWRSCGSMWKQKRWRLQEERTWSQETSEDCEEMSRCLWRPLQTALDKEKWKSQRRKWRQLCGKESWFCTFCSFLCDKKQSGHLQRRQTVIVVPAGCVFRQKQSISENLMMVWRHPYCPLTLVRWKADICSPTSLL